MSSRLKRCVPNSERIAIGTKSANERASIFFMTVPRCTLTVISLTPSSAAICLFIRPAVTKPSIPCCFETRTRLQKSYFPGGTVTIALESEPNRIEKILFAEWFGQEFDRAGLHGTYCHRDIAVIR
jgi:hypothetical protein